MLEVHRRRCIYDLRIIEILNKYYLGYKRIPTSEKTKDENPNIKKENFMI